MKKVTYKNWNCEIQKGKYQNNMNLALVLKDIEDGSPVANVTVNTDELLVEPDLAYVKNYSENEGMLEALQKAGVIKEILGEKRLGWVTAPLVRFNLEDIEEI